MGRRGLFRSARLPTYLPLLCLILAFAVGTAVSPTPDLMRRALWPHVVGLAAYLLLAKLPLRQEVLPWLGWMAILAGLALALLVPLGMVTVRPLTSLGDPVLGHLGLRARDALNGNVVAGYLVLLLPFAAARMVLSRQPGSRPPSATTLLCLEGTVLMFVAILQTGSRAALLAAAISLLLLVAIRWSWMARWVLAGALSLGAVAGALWGWTNIALRVMASGTTGLAERQEIWSRALMMMRAFPLTGVGLGSFEVVVASLYPLYLEPGGSATHAHNLFLQIGLDLGIPGMIAYLAILALSLRMAVAVWRSSRKRAVYEESVLALATIASLCGVVGHGLLDCAVWANRGAFLPWLVLGLAAILYRLKEE